ncbi:MAG: nucleotidyltransferase domain-containing protein [Candidatus Methanomethylicia archaeon]
MSYLGSENSKLHERVIEAVKQYVKQYVIPTLKPLLIILYDSFTRGDYTRGSDIDLLIVSEYIPKNYWDRWSLVYEVIDGLPLDPHIYTPEEFREMIIDGRMTALDALTEGIVIHANTEYQEEINRLLSETLKRRVKYRNMWIPIQYMEKLHSSKTLKQNYSHTNSSQ